MTVKRRLKSIRLDKIAAVGSPCQAPATVALIKRAPASPVTEMAKKTFDEALRAQLVGEQISEVFWRAFDKQYAVREAFREALADELAAGGDGTEATEGFTSAMRTIAETAATLAREAGSSAEPDLESAVEQAVNKWLNQQETSEMKITTKAALKAAVAAFNPETSPAAQITLIKSAAKELGAEDELPAEGLLAVEKTAPATDPALAKALREIELLKMSPDVRKHFDGLAESAQPAFLAKSEADRAAEVEAANAGDPVVYKTAGGIEIRKSDGTAAAMLAKQLDETNAKLVVLTEKSATNDLDAKAAAYPHVNKAVAVQMLKSAATVGADTEAGKAVIASLDSMNKAQSGVFKSLGSTTAPVIGGNIEKARQDFNGTVSKIMARDSIGMADAMTKARTEEPALFAEAYPETAALDDEA